MNFTIGSLKVFDFLKSDFKYLPLGKARKIGCLKILDFSKSDFRIWHWGKLEKLDVRESEKKTEISEVSEESRVFDLGNFGLNGSVP